MPYNYYLSVAGVTLLFEADQPLLENKEFLPFLTDAAKADLHAHIAVSHQLPAPGENALYSDRFCTVARDQAGRIQKFFFDSVDGPYTVTTYDPDGRQVWIEYPAIRKRDGLQLENCFYFLGFEEYLLRSSKLCLHAACVDTALGGILFSGISGIGKSTQADLWCSHRGAKQINGDRPIIGKEDGGWFAWGSPYAGSSKCYVNDKCRVAAVILLKKSASCSLKRLTRPEAFRGVWAGLTVHSWDASFVEAASDLTMDLITNIPVYEYSCTPDAFAVDFLEQALRKDLDL